MTKPLHARARDICWQLDSIDGFCLNGNLLKLLSDGEMFVPAMMGAIAKAAHTIDLEMFRIHPGRLASLLLDALLSAAMRGVRVRVVADAVGSRATTSDYWQTMIDGGVDLRLFRPIRLSSPIRSMQRDHRKILLVDDTFGYLGGMSFDDVFFENRNGPTWRENMVEVRGPILQAFRASFLETWREVGGESDTQQCASSPEVGGAHAHFISSTALTQRTRALFLATISAAGSSVWIANPFILLDEPILDALASIARSGIDVRLVIPGGEAFDRFPLIRFAMRGLFSALLAAGVRIFEYQPAMLHAKTMMIDKRWAFVGSSNLDARSLYHNHEADLASCDGPFVESVSTFFAATVRESEEVTLSRWRTRSWKAHASEFVAGMLRTQL